MTIDDSGRMAPCPPRRVVALGASNLTRGFQTVVSSLRAASGADVEILAALGHGRSYGAPSRFVGRTLPGILQCGLWAALEARPALPTRALVTDVGNDLVYGCSAALTLGWVEEALVRLRRLTPDIVVTDLPLSSLGRLTARRFLFFRSVFFPWCRVSLADLLAGTRDLSSGLERLAGDFGARFVRLRHEWYGVDPIHIRPPYWRPAWQEILGSAAGPGGSDSLAEWLRLYALRPERQWMFGRELVTPQPARALARGGRVWLY